MTESINGHALSPTEERILRMLATTGATNKEIARECGITEGTVKVHLKAIVRKLGVKNRTQMVIWALSHGEVRP